MRLLFAIGGIEFLKYLNQNNCGLKSAVQKWCDATAVYAKPDTWAIFSDQVLVS